MMITRKCPTCIFQAETTVINMSIVSVYILNSKINITAKVLESCLSNGQETLLFLTALKPKILAK